MNRILKFAAALTALVGLGDSIYLTAYHLRAEPVPCNILSGCETVLTSPYAEIAGVPLAAFGAAAYFVAFALAILALYGGQLAWKLFGLQVALMAAYTVWLIYVQAVILGAFCQFCLLSAVTTFILLTLFIVSAVRARSEAAV